MGLDYNQQMARVSVSRATAQAPVKVYRAGGSAMMSLLRTFTDGTTPIEATAAVARQYGKDTYVVTGPGGVYIYHAEVEPPRQAKVTLHAQRGGVISEGH